MTNLPNTRVHCSLTVRDAALVHRLIDSHCQALRNWISSAIEAGNAEYAKALVRELRVHEHLFSKTNTTNLDRPREDYTAAALASTTARMDAYDAS